MKPPAKPQPQRPRPAPSLTTRTSWRHQGFRESQRRFRELLPDSLLPGEKVHIQVVVTLTLPAQPAKP